MPTLVELTDQHTSLSSDEVAHLVALVSEWGMLADFSFADLLIYVPVSSDGGINWLTASQVRARASTLSGVHGSMPGLMMTSPASRNRSATAS